MKSLNITEAGCIWGKWQVDQNNWVLTNGWNNFCYLLIGEQKAMLIDTGYGEGNVREVVEEITEKPVVVVNTHGHYDHTGGNFWWDSCFCAEGTKQDITMGASEAFLIDYYNRLPKDFKFNYVKEGDVFDLGGRHIEVLSFDAHAQSSIMLLDREKRQLYTGDEIDPSQVLLIGRSDYDTRQMVENHLAGMEKLLARQSEYDMLFPAHNGVYISKQYVKDFRILDTMILKGENKLAETVAGFNWAEKVEADSDLADYYPGKRSYYGLATIIHS
ncbi:MAG TPA: MBL fold metallo-hydrolase [Candidatus Pelethocola excrementipullorum]|nr:MBL fold metallo-hydrolase [Candidatus Pelethocola excrementipullorum]